MVSSGTEEMGEIYEEWSKKVTYTKVCSERISYINNDFNNHIPTIFYNLLLSEFNSLSFTFKIEGLVGIVEILHQTCFEFNFWAEYPFVYEVSVKYINRYYQGASTE